MDKNEKYITPPNQARNYRNEANLSQSDVAFLLDIKNSGRISEWENGLSNPSIEHLFALSLIYQRLPDQIYSEMRKRLSQRIAVRYKLLQELKDKKRIRRDEGG